MVTRSYFAILHYLSRFGRCCLNGYEDRQTQSASMWAVVGMRLTPTLSVGSSLSCQLNAAGLHAAAAAANSSKRSSTNFSTSSDNVEEVNCTSADVGYVSAVDVTQRRAPPSPAPDRRRQLLDQLPAGDLVDVFPVGGGRRPVNGIDSDRQRRVDQLSAEVDARTITPTFDHATRSTSAIMNRDNNGPMSGTTTGRASRPVTWSCEANDVIFSAVNQRDDVDRGVIASTP